MDQNKLLKITESLPKEIKAELVNKQEIYGDNKLPDRDDKLTEKQAVAKRRKLVMDLTVEGLTQKDIAKIVIYKYKNDIDWNENNLPKSYGPKDVNHDINVVTSNYVEEYLDSAEKYLVIEIQRIESMVRSLWDRATKQDGSPAELSAIDRMLKLQKRKAKLLGLDAPEKIDVLAQTTSDGQYKGFGWANPDDIETDVELTEEEIQNRVQTINDEEDE